MFYLVRIDAPDVVRYTVKDNIFQVIGRGVLPECDSKRISRDHASVKVDRKTFVLKALHLNPCFFKKCDSNKIVLPQGETVELIDGDQFGLLPDAYWYQLHYAKDETGCEINDGANEGIREPDNQNQKELEENQNIRTKRPHIEGQEIIPLDSCAKKVKKEPKTESDPIADPPTSLGIQSNLIKTEKMDIETTIINGNNLAEESTDTGNNVTSVSMDFDATAQEFETEGKENAQSKDSQENDKDTTSESLNLNYPEESDTDIPSSDEAKVTPDKINSLSTPDENGQPNTDQTTALSTPVENEQPNSDQTTALSAPENNEQPSPDQTTALSTPVENEQPNLDDTTTLSSLNEKQPTEADEESFNNVVVKKEPLTPDKVGAITTTSESISIVKQEPVSPTARPGHSQANTNDTSAANGGAAKDAGPTAAPQPQTRERCFYGAQCYRKNAQHKQQYSHPGDADYGGAGPLPCPYGRTCRRRSARHRTCYLHPARTDNHCPAKRRKVNPPSDSDSEESDSDSPPGDLIVFGKRTRRAVPRDAGSESDDEAQDPYATDESDDWKPT